MCIDRRSYCHGCFTWTPAAYIVCEYKVADLGCVEEFQKFSQICDECKQNFAGVRQSVPSLIDQPARPAAVDAVAAAVKSGAAPGWVFGGAGEKTAVIGSGSGGGGGGSGNVNASVNPPPVQATPSRPSSNYNPPNPPNPTQYQHVFRLPDYPASQAPNKGKGPARRK